jgi:hypothetical protein
VRQTYLGQNLLDPVSVDTGRPAHHPQVVAATAAGWEPRLQQNPDLACGIGELDV